MLFFSSTDFHNNIDVAVGFSSYSCGTNSLLLPVSLQELSDINQMIRQGGVSKKRAFTMEGDETESPSKCLRQESDDVLLKRLQDVVSERASL